MYLSRKLEILIGFRSNVVHMDIGLDNNYVGIESRVEDRVDSIPT